MLSGKGGHFTYWFDAKSQLCLKGRRVHDISSFQPIIDQDVTARSSTGQAKNGSGQIYVIRLDDGGMDLAINNGTFTVIDKECVEGN